MVYLIPFVQALRQKIESKRDSRNLFCESLVFAKDLAGKIIEVSWKKSIRPRQPPESLAVELTNFCNIRCAMCPYPMMTREKGYMPLNTFKRICDESKKFKIPITYLSFFGEPLLYPHLEDALKYFKENGFGMGGIATNGLLLDDKIIEIIIKYCRVIRIAIDSTNKNVYEILRNNNQFVKVCKNTKELIELSKGSNLLIEIQWLKTRLNQHEGVISFEKMFGKHDNVNYIIKECGVYAPNGPDLTLDSTKKLVWKNCSQPFYYLNILWNGDCVLCCRDINGEQVIGNINNNNLFTIWYGKRAKEMRECFKNGQLDSLPVCRRCNLH